MAKKYTNTQLFCAKFLSGTGITSENFDDLVSCTPDLLEDYIIVKRENKDFYYNLAQKLRDLWPPGNKVIQGQEYPWRDSVENLRKRLMHLWAIRFNTKSFTIDECLMAARRYLSQFEEDSTYMKILKYFILKQTKTYDENGKISIVNESKLADMLEAGEGMIPVDANEYSNDMFVEEGMLV